MSVIVNITLQSAIIYKKNYLSSLTTFITLNLEGHDQSSPPSKGNTPEYNHIFNFHKTHEDFLLVSLIEKGLFSDTLLAEGIILLASLHPFQSNFSVVPVYKYSTRIAEIHFNIYIDNPLERPQISIIRKVSKEFNIPIELPDPPQAPTPKPVQKKPNELDLITHGIQISDLAYDRQIYSSQSGKQEVHLGRILATNTPVAIKVSYCEGGDEFNKVQREALAISQLSHPNICRVFGTLLDMKGGKLKNLIVLESCQGISLRHEIEKRGKDSKYFAEEEIRRYLKELTSAFAHIQSKHIVHSDIKPDNIVISETGELKIIDFGISLHGYSELFETTKTLKVGGTIPYFSPLQMQGYILFIQGLNPSCTVKHNPIKSDVFALGLTFIHLTSLNVPTGLNNLDPGLQYRIQNSVSSLPYSEWVKEFILQMLIIDENLRPDFLMLLEGMTNS